MISGKIYHIFCKVTGKAYVGQTWEAISQRWTRHKEISSPCVKLSRAIQKYGPEAFVISALGEFYNQTDLDAAEIYWIHYFDCIKNGYNIREGGSHGKLSEETINKMRITRNMPDARAQNSKRASKRWANQENRTKASEKTVDWINKNPQAWNQQISAMTEGKRTDKYKALRSGIAKEIFAFDEIRIQSSRARGGRPFKDNHGVRYDTLNKAARILNLQRSNIKKVLLGKRKHSGGFTFTFIE